MVDVAVIDVLAWFAGALVLAALGLTFTDAAILVGIVFYAITKVSDVRGWTPSTALVRQENADLRERKGFLEGEVDRLDLADRAKAEKLASANTRIEELEKRDQAAVLEAVAAHDKAVIDIWTSARANQEAIQHLLRDHEIDANRRHTESLEVLREIRDGLQASP